jgi:hypothetical protein
MKKVISILILMLALSTSAFARPDVDIGTPSLTSGKPVTGTGTTDDASCQLLYGSIEELYHQLPRDEEDGGTYLPPYDNEGDELTRSMMCELIDNWYDPYQCNIVDTDKSRNFWINHYDEEFCTAAQ